MKPNSIWKLSFILLGLSFIGLIYNIPSLMDIAGFLGCVIFVIMAVCRFEDVVATIRKLMSFTD